MNKKIILIISTIVILILIAGGVFWIVSNKSEDSGVGNILSNLFPSGGERPLGGDGLNPSGIFPDENDEEEIFIQLTQNAISGSATLPQASTSIRYIEKSTGHVYEIDPRGENKNRISNTTILKTFESFWAKDADKLIIKYFDNDIVRNFLGRISTSTGALEGIFLPADVSAVAVSKFEDKIFYLQKNDSGIYGVTADFNNSKKSAIFSFPFSDFNINWFSKDKISFLTKPASSVEGYLYFLDLKTKDFKKVIGGIRGLTALASPDADKIIYSQSVNGGLTTKVFNTKDKTTRDFGINALPEKCVWSQKEKDIVYCGSSISLPMANYPDEWYRGEISFNDSIWKINILTGETNVVLQKTNTDAINLFLTLNEDYLILTNKKDNTLWSLRLK